MAGRTGTTHFPGAAPTPGPHAVSEGQLLLVKVALSKCQPAESFPRQLSKHLLSKRQKVILDHGAC